MVLKIEIIEDKADEIDIDIIGEIVRLNSGNEDAEEYSGSYEVVPSAQKQVLETAQKVMRNDVIINEIPYKETPNSGGRGITVRIG